MHKNKFKLYILIISWLFIFEGVGLCEITKVNIDLNLKNISEKENRPPKRYMTLSGYKELDKVSASLGGKTLLGRTITVKWHVINYYIPKNPVFGDYYPLFDFTWFREGLKTQYLMKSGKWTEMQQMPTGFNLKPHSVALIHGIGETELLISPTVCFQGMCLGGGGEKNGKYKEKVFKKIKKKNYTYEVVGYPITKSVYVKIPENIKTIKPLELSGTFVLGDSSITTKINRFFFPFDKYSFNFMYSVYFPTMLEINVNKIEDLELASPKTYEFNINDVSDKEIFIELNRGAVFKNIIWNLVLFFVPLLFWLIGKEKIKTIIRLLTYGISLVTLFLLLPTAKYIPWYNAFAFLNYFVYCGCVILLEWRFKQNP